jgi:hypothetical protein
MSANFDLSNLALQAVCPGNEILYDDKGLPSIMVKIPRMTYAQLGMGESTATHPAFIINGTEVPEIYISKYQNIIQDGRAYSLPGVDPRVNITLDAAISACVAKGSGWHCMTAWNGACSFAGARRTALCRWAITTTADTAARPSTRPFLRRDIPRRSTPPASVPVPAR